MFVGLLDEKEGVGRCCLFVSDAVPLDPVCFLKRRIEDWKVEGGKVEDWKVGR
jgi:hypothetical protein